MKVSVCQLHAAPLFQPQHGCDCDREQTVMARVVTVVEAKDLDRVLTALQPFADEASAYDEAKPYPDEDAHLGGFSDYTFGDLLRARSVYAALREEQPA